MHMSPGLPIMRSADLVNWRLVGYAYDTLADDSDALLLRNGRDAYGKGSWASSLRHHDGVFYATTFSQTTGRTYVYTTKDVERGPWQTRSFAPALHDHSLFFDDDGRVYMVYGGGAIRLRELNADCSGLKPGGVDQVIIADASAPAGPNIMLKAEGSQLLKVDGKYYLLNITWPRGGMRTVVVHRADRLTGPWEGRVALQDKGVAQGGLIDTPDGKWFAMLFRDFGAVGRIPYLVPVRWVDGWPVIGDAEGRVPMTLDLPAGGQGASGATGVVASDEFDRKPEEPALPLAWQWNHNPDGDRWSLAARPGWLRLTAGVAENVERARNTLTQRTFGPTSSATTSLDVSGMKPGDHAGLVVLQEQYGSVGVRVGDDGARSIVMERAENRKPVEVARVPLASDSVVRLRADCDFNDRRDTATFFYAVGDGGVWQPIGEPVKLRYTLTHFMGARFGLFNYATRDAGGHADFDYYRVGPADGPAAANP